MKAHAKKTQVVTIGAESIEGLKAWTASLQAPWNEAKVDNCMLYLGGDAWSWRQGGLLAFSFWVGTRVP